MVSCEYMLNMVERSPVLSAKDHVILYQRQKGIAKHAIALFEIVNSHLTQLIKKLSASDGKMRSIKKCESHFQTDVGVPLLCTSIVYHCVYQ